MGSTDTVEAPTTFRSGALTLEGRLSVPAAARAAAVVCHPHPHYGGTMDSSVVVATAAALARDGVATLRFNFRGVGASEGESRADSSEIEDARAALAALRTHAPGVPIALGGYSFGSMIAMLAGHDDPAVDRLFAIALPVPMFDPSPIVASAKPKLFVSGDRDSYCPVPKLQALVAALAGENRVVTLDGADHFLFGHEERVARAVAEFLR